MQLPLVMACDKRYHEKHKGEDNMQANKIKMEIRPEILIQAVMNMKKKKEILFWKTFLQPALLIILKALKSPVMITN